MSVWDGYKPGSTPTPVPSAGGSVWTGYNPTVTPTVSKQDQSVIKSFQNIDPNRRAVVLQNFQQRAKTGDKEAARKLQLLVPHFEAPAPATPDYKPKDIGSKIGAALYGFGSGVVTSAKNTAEDVITSPHAVNAAGLALASMAKGDKGAVLAHNKQIIANEANKSSFVRGVGGFDQPIAQGLAKAGGRTLENILNVTTLGEGTLVKQGVKQGAKAVAGNEAVSLAARQATKGAAGYIRNLASGQFAKTVVHPDDASVMASFIDHARGITKLSPAQAKLLGTAADRISQHYGIGTTATTDARLATAFDKILSGSPEALRTGKLGETGSLSFPKGGPLLTDRGGSRLVKGAALGAGYGVAQAGQQNITDPGQLAKTVGGSALMGGALGAGVPLVAKGIGGIAKGVVKLRDNPVDLVAEKRVMASGQKFGSPPALDQAVKTEAVRIKQDPAQLRAIDEAYGQNGWKGLTADTGKQPTQVSAVGEKPTKGAPTVMTAEQGAKNRAIDASTQQNLSSRSRHFDQSLQSTIKGIEDSGGYQKELAARGGDKVVTNAAVLDAAKAAGPLDHNVILNAKPLDKIDTVTLVRAHATVDSALKEFTDAWQGGEYTDAELTKMSKHVSKLEAGYKIMSAEPGRATQIQSTFIDDAFKRAQKLKELVDTTKGVTSEVRNQRIAQDLAAFDKAVAKAKQSGVFSGATLTKLHNAVSEYATTAKLTSPLTHAKNILSNATTIGQKGAENLVTGSWAVAKGETGVGQLGRIFGTSQGLRNASAQFVKDFKQAWNPKAKDLASGIDKQEIQPAIPGAVGKAIRTPFNLLAAGDNFFKTLLRDSEYHQMAYGKAYQEGFRGSALKARIDELVKTPTPDMAAKAEKTALEFTFQDDPGVIANGISGILSKLPLLRLLVPFVKTPTNVVKFQYQRSALGLFSKRNLQDIAAGGIERREAVARLAVGAGMTTAAVMGVMNLGDRITGAAPSKPGEKDNFYAAGKKPYSILIGGKWWQYNSISPLGQYLTQAVALRDALTNGNSKTAGNIFGSMGVTIGKGILDLPFVSGVNNVIAALNDPSNQSLANKAFGQIITGLIPNVSRDVANASDSTPRQSKTITDQIKAMVPGLKQQLPARQTVFGQDQLDTRTAIERGFVKVTSNDQSTKLTKALDEIGSQTGYYPTLPKAGAKVNGKALTPDQFKKYQQESGQLFASKLEKALNDAHFRDLNADDKKRSVQQMETDARNKAANDVAGKQTKNPSHRVKRY